MRLGKTCRNSATKIARKVYAKFRLIWKSNATRFNQAIEKKKLNFKVVNNVTIDKDDKSFVKYVQSSLFNFIGYDLDNYNKHRAFEYCCCIQTRSKISGKK